MQSDIKCKVEFTILLHENIRRLCFAKSPGPGPQLYLWPHLLSPHTSNFHSGNMKLLTVPCADSLSLFPSALPILISQDSVWGSIL